MGTPLFRFLGALPMEVRERIQKIAEILLREEDAEELRQNTEEVDRQLLLLDQITMVDVSIVRMDLQTKRGDMVCQIERIRGHIAVLRA